jgi:hypothetical protein
MLQSMSPVQKLIMSVLNPWEVSACIPDGSKGTGCFTIRELGVITTGATGSAGSVILIPQSPYGMFAIDGSSNSATYTVAGNFADASGIATAAALFKACRCVSAGVRLTYVGNTINDQGVITAAQIGPQVVYSTTFNTGTPGTINSNSQWIHQEPLRNGIEVTWRPDDEMDYAKFVDLNTGSVSTGTERTKPGIFIGLDRLATAGACAINYEIVANFEGVYGTQGVIAGGMNMPGYGQQSITSNGWYEGLSKVIDNITPIAAAVGGAAYNSALNYAPRVVNAAIGGMANGYVQSLRPILQQPNSGFGRPRLSLGYRDEL